MKDIAGIVGVSLKTVSLALNNKYGVKNKTRELILKTAKELNYTPNQIARSLAGKRTNTIGVLIPDISESYYAEILSNIEKVAAQNNYNILLINTNWDPVLEFKSINIFYISLFYVIPITLFGYLVIPKYGIAGMAIVVLITMSFSIPISKYTLRSILKFSYLNILWPQIIMFFISFGGCLLISPIAKQSLILFLFSLLSVLVLYIISLYILDKEMFLWCKTFALYLLNPKYKNSKSEYMVEDIRNK